MSRFTKTLLVGAALCAVNAVTISATGPQREQAYSCSEGYHWYNICPFQDYCGVTGAADVCQQLCPEWDASQISSNGCDRLGECEAVGCTFGNN